MKDPELDDTLRRKKVERIFKFYTSYKPKNGTYACLMISFEMLQIFNIFLQFYTLDVVLNGQFLSYGYSFFMNEDMTDYIFPKIAKCQFNYHGPGGEIINADSLCLLPLNILHEKLFLLLWFYLILIAIISFIHLLVMRCLALCCKRFRRYLLDGATYENTENMADFIVLSQIEKNVDAEMFWELLILLKNKRNKNV